MHDQLWHLHDRSINFDVTFLSIRLRHHICYMTLRDWPKVSIALMNAFKAMTSDWLSSWTLIFGPGFLPLCTVHNWMRQKHDTLLKILIHFAHVIQCDEALFWKSYYKKHMKNLAVQVWEVGKDGDERNLSNWGLIFCFFPKSPWPFWFDRNLHTLSKKMIGTIRTHGPMGIPVKTMEQDDKVSSFQTSISLCEHQNVWDLRNATLLLHSGISFCIKSSVGLS